MNHTENSPLHSHSEAPFFSKAWLVAGIATGLVAALFSVLVPQIQRDGNVEVVASVNGTEISREKYLSHLQALSSDKKDKVTSEDASYVLERIIEEELLVQRGLEVGLHLNDKRTRAAMIDAMISMTTASAESSEPSNTELQEFFKNNIDYFTPTDRLRVRQLVIADAERAAEAFRRLQQGAPYQQIKQEFAEQVALNLPDTLLPPVKVREYLGPSAVNRLQYQQPGFILEPEPVGNSYRILILVDKVQGQSPQLVSVRDQVEAELVRRKGDQSLRNYLEWLKGRADIQYPSELPM